MTHWKSLINQFCNCYYVQSPHLILENAWMVWVFSFLDLDILAGNVITSETDISNDPSQWFLEVLIKSDRRIYPSLIHQWFDDSCLKFSTLELRGESCYKYGWSILLQTMVIEGLIGKCLPQNLSTAIGDLYQ